MRPTAKTACSTGAGRLMTTPTPRPASWRSASSRRSAPTPRGAPRKLVAWLQDHRPRRTPWPAPQHRGRRPGPRGACAAATSPPQGLALERTLRPRHHTPTTSGTIDFKGWFRTGDGSRVDPLTVQDAASRYLIACQRAGAPHRPGDAARVSARIPASTASPRSSGPTTARPSPASAWAASHSLSVMVDQAGYPP